MTHTEIRQVKNKDGTTTSDVRQRFASSQKKLMKDGFFQESRERNYFTKSKGEKKRNENNLVDVGISRR